MNILIALVTPAMGDQYAANPLLVVPVLAGSGLSYLLSMHMIRRGLSLEASLGLQGGEQGEIRLDRMGRVLQGRGEIGADWIVGFDHKPGSTAC